MCLDVNEAALDLLRMASISSISWCQVFACVTLMFLSGQPNTVHPAHLESHTPETCIQRTKNGTPSLKFGMDRILSKDVISRPACTSDPAVSMSCAATFPYDVCLERDGTSCVGCTEAVFHHCCSVSPRTSIASPTPTYYTFYPALHCVPPASLTLQLPPLISPSQAAQLLPSCPPNKPARSCPSPSGVSSNKRKRSWSRAVFSNLQRKGLEKRFQLQKYITKPDRRQLAATLGLTDAQVKVWFQNRRMKWRHSKEAKDQIVAVQPADSRGPLSPCRTAQEHELETVELGCQAADSTQQTRSSCSSPSDSEEIDVEVDT